MAKILTLILCMSSMVVVADVYRSVGADGKVTYSDQPGAGSKKIKLPEVMVYSPPPIPKRPEQREVKIKSPIYKRITIVSPQADETIWDNQGVVDLVVALDPALQLTLGHRILVSIDGKTRGEPRVSTRVHIAGLDRGTHSIAARVVDANGKSLIVTESASFHLHRQSALFLNRQAAPATGGVAP